MMHSLYIPATYLRGWEAEHNIQHINPFSVTVRYLILLNIELKGLRIPFPSSGSGGTPLGMTTNIDTEGYSYTLECPQSSVGLDDIDARGIPKIRWPGQPAIVRCYDTTAVLPFFGDLRRIAVTKKRLKHVRRGPNSRGAGPLLLAMYVALLD